MTSCLRYMSCFGDGICANGKEVNFEERQRTAIIELIGLTHYQLVSRWFKIRIEVFAKELGWMLEEMDPEKGSWGARRGKTSAGVDLLTDCDLEDDWDD